MTHADSGDDKLKSGIYSIDIEETEVYDELLKGADAFEIYKDRLSPFRDLRYTYSSYHYGPVIICDAKSLTTFFEKVGNTRIYIRQLIFLKSFIAKYFSNLTWKYFKEKASKVKVQDFVFVHDDDMLNLIIELSKSWPRKESSYTPKGTNSLVI